MYQRDVWQLSLSQSEKLGMQEPAEICLSLCLSTCLSVKVNGVSPEPDAAATGVPIDPTHRRCPTYGFAEGVCVCVIGISSLDCDSVCGMRVWVIVCGLVGEPAAGIQGCVCVYVIVDENLPDINKLAMSSQCRESSVW